MPGRRKKRNNPGLLMTKEREVLKKASFSLMLTVIFRLARIKNSFHTVRISVLWLNKHSHTSKELLSKLAMFLSCEVSWVFFFKSQEHNGCANDALM